MIEHNEQPCFNNLIDINRTEYHDLLLFKCTKSSVEGKNQQRAVVIILPTLVTVPHVGLGLKGHRTHNCTFTSNLIPKLSNESPTKEIKNMTVNISNK